MYCSVTELPEQTLTADAEAVTEVGAVQQGGVLNGAEVAVPELEPSQLVCAYTRR